MPSPSCRLVRERDVVERQELSAGVRGAAERRGRAQRRGCGRSPVSCGPMQVDRVVDDARLAVGGELLERRAASAARRSCTPGTGSPRRRRSSGMPSAVGLRGRRAGRDAAVVAAVAAGRRSGRRAEPAAVLVLVAIAMPTATTIATTTTTPTATNAILRRRSTAACRARSAASRSCASRRLALSFAMLRLSTPSLRHRSVVSSSCSSSRRVACGRAASSQRSTRAVAVRGPAPSRRGRQQQQRACRGRATISVA